MANLTAATQAVNRRKFVQRWRWHHAMKEGQTTQRTLPNEARFLAPSIDLQRDASELPASW